MNRTAHHTTILTFFAQPVKIILKKRTIPAVSLSNEKNTKYFQAYYRFSLIFFGKKAPPALQAEL